MRKYGIVVLVGVIVIASLVAIGYKKKSTAVAPVRDSTVAVLSTQVKTGSLVETVVLSGTLEALHSANVVAKSSGKVGEIMVELGTPVAAGQTMIALESEDLAAALALSQTSVEKAQINLILIEKQYERGKTLFNSGALSQVDFDNNYQGALDKARVDLKSAQATLAQSQVRYNDSFIKSPLTGVVTAKNINVGEMAGSSSPIITVINLDKLLVTVNVNENQVNRLQVGQDVAVKVSAVSTTPLHGTISNIALAANPSSKIFPIKIQIDNQDHVLKPGMFAEASFTWTSNPGLLVPNSAVRVDGDDKKIFLINSGLAKSVKVTTGESDAQNTIILSGVKEGEVIISNVPANLKDGAKVKAP